VKRPLSTALAITFVLGSALAAQTRGARGALPGRGHPDAANGGISVGCLEALSLTDTQKASLDQLRQNLPAAVAPLVEQRRSYRDQIDTALESASPDPTAIGRLVIADHGVGEQIRAFHDQFQTAFQALLTPEQLANYTALRQNGVCAERGRPPR
jgi:Spy/CpxP family protein refolding chaperone